MTGPGVVHAIHISGGGVPKLPVAQGTVTVDGLRGDGHADTVNHGGRERALCLYSLEVIAALADEGHPIRPGCAGENLTISGIAWDRIRPRTRLVINDVVIEVTRPTTPCAKIAACFRDGDVRRISHDAHPGWSRFYARVVTPGVLAVGDTVVLEAGAGEECVRCCGK